jgi:membrane-associated phospholipid phosphatase
MYRADIEFKSISEYLVNIIYKMDTPVLNCFPSMHCVISFIFIYVSLTEKNLNIKYKVLLTIWSLLVIVSTLFVKQHVLVDVISAFILSLIVFILASKIKYLKDFDVIKR